MKVLRLEERDIPDQIKDNEVLVEMYGSAINHGDIAFIRGLVPGQPPALEKSNSQSIVAGSEGVGTVLKVGKNVQKIKPKDWVIPSKFSLGTWTTHLVSEESNFLVVPQKIKQPYAAMLGSAAIADRLLSDFVRLERGDVIIQNGGASGVAMAVSQLAFSRGIKTISVLRHHIRYAELASRVKSLGCAVVAPYEYVASHKLRSLIAELPKPKLAINSIGGASATELARILAPGGTLVTIGSEGHHSVQLAPSSFILNDIVARGFWFPRWLEKTSHDNKQKAVDSIVHDVTAMKLFAQYFLLKDYLRAIDRFKQKHRGSRVLITTNHVDSSDISSI